MTQPSTTSNPSAAALSLTSTTGRKWLLHPIQSLSHNVRLVRDVSLPTPHVSHSLALKSLTLPTPAAAQLVATDAHSWTRAYSAEPAHILRLYDVFLPSPNTVHLLMEYCPGADLTSSLRTETPALRVLSAVAAAVHAVLTAADQPAHANISPSHILLDNDGNPKLSGWGYTRARRLSSKKRRLTERDDVKALAAMLFQIIYGRRWDPERRTFPSDPPVSDATKSLIESALSVKSKNVPELTVFRYDIAAARKLVPQCTAALAPVKNNQRREQFLGDDLDSVRGLNDTGVDQRTTGDDEEEHQARQRQPNGNGHVAARAQNGTVAASKALTETAEFDSAEEVNESNVVDVIKRFTTPTAEPFNQEDVTLLVRACTRSPDLPESIFKVLFTLKISKNPIVAFKAITLIHQLLVEGPAKLTALAITHDGFLSWTESEWARERIPSKPGKPHMYSYCFAAGEIAWYMAVIRKRIVAHAKYAQAFSTHWIPRPDGVPKLQKTCREACRLILEIVEKCNALIRKILGSRDPIAELKQSAVPVLANELAKSYHAMCYVYATADAQKKMELRPELTIAHRSTKNAIDALRAREDIASNCPSFALLELEDEPPASFNIEELTSSLKKKKKRKKKKAAVATEGMETVANDREVSPEQEDLEEEAPQAMSKLRKSPEREDLVDDIPVVDSIEDKPKKPTKRRDFSGDGASPAIGYQNGVSGRMPKEGATRERPLPPVPNRPVAPVMGMEKLSLSIRKGTTRSADVAEPRPSPYSAIRDSPVRPLAKGRSSSADDFTGERMTAMRRRRRENEDSSDSESESPVRRRVPNGRSRTRNGTPDVEGTESDPEIDRQPAVRKTNERRKNWKNTKLSDTESDTSSTDEGEDDSVRRRRRKKSPKKSKGERNRARRQSPRRHIDEKKIPFDKEPPTKKKSAKKRVTASDETETDYSGGSKEALAAAASGKKTPSINPKYEVAPYEVQFGQQIGSGGFGVVFKAKFRGDTVAVKKIHAHALSNASSVAEFQSEVAVLCTLHHPNILRFVGACTRPPNLMIITEFMARGTLFDILHQSSMRVTWPMRKKFALDTCKGMAYLHASKLLHRDLKSSNLMLDKDFNCKVGDFGLTRISRGSAAVQMTGQCGTFQYMAVEVLANKPYSEKADVFSFGILLWEMVARKLPYFGMQPMQVGIAVLQQGMRPPIPPKCPAPLVKLMRACWDSDPNRRPSFAQLVQALEAMPE